MGIELWKEALKTYSITDEALHYPPVLILEKETDRKKADDLARELDEFIAPEEAVTALRLLERTGENFHFGTVVYHGRCPNPEYAAVYDLTGEGFVVRLYKTIFGPSWRDDKFLKKFSSTAKDMAIAVISEGNRRPEHVMIQLLSELDSHAKSAIRNLRQTPSNKSKAYR